MPIQISASMEDLRRVLELIKDAAPDADITVTVNGQQQDTSGAATPPGDDAIEKLRREASPRDLRLLTRFVAQQASEHGAVIDPGPPHLKYVRIHLPHHRGAYCYVTTRGYVDFRLTPDCQEGCRFAVVRKGQNHGAPYCLRLRLDSDAALEEALELARTAVRQVLGGAQD